MKFLFPYFLAQKPLKFHRPNPTHLEEQVTQQSQLSVLLDELEQHPDIATWKGRKEFVAACSLTAERQREKTGKGCNPRRKVLPRQQDLCKQTRTWRSPGLVGKQTGRTQPGQASIG